jgi:hypothetical protein
MGEKASSRLRKVCKGMTRVIRVSRVIAVSGVIQVMSHTEETMLG